MLNEQDLHPYQSRAYTHIIDNDHAGLFMDMGLGKTVSTLTAVKKLIYEELDIDTVLIIAPKRVAESVWSQEIEKWSHLKGLTVSKIIGPAAKRKEALNAKADIYIISRDNIAWLCGLYGGLKLPFDMLIIDESSSFKSPKSQRFKALKRVQPSFQRVVLLTGTPAPNGLIDLWAQLYLLDIGERLGKTLTAFRTNYFTPGQRNGSIVYKYNLLKGGQKAIHSRIKDICISMKATDYLDMPEARSIEVPLVMPDDIKKQYEQFAKEQVLSIIGAEEEISAVNAAALSNKLLQFANGAVYDADRNVHPVHDLKIDALTEMIEEANGKPVLVAWTYRHDQDRIHKALAKHNPRALKTDQDIQDWNAGKIEVLTMHPASGGHGLNLQAGGNTVIWFGQTWSLELYQQLNARLYRQGQTASFVALYHLIVTDTIDADVMKSLAKKDSTQETLLQAVKLIVERWTK